MSRYTYNANLVTQALDSLDEAAGAINNTNSEMQKGINMFYNARGAENIDVDFTPITNFQSSVLEYIDTMSTEIRNKAQEIEEYENAPWYKKLFATLAMGALKLVEGLASFVEIIGDGLVSIVGFVGGIFSSEFQDCIGEYVKKDWVGDTVSSWYEEGWLQDVNKYSIMSHQSTAANILKGIGVATGYVILSVATAGAGTAVSLGVSTTAAAIGGIGSGTQAGLQSGKSFNQAFAQGVKEGVVAAGTTLVFGALANKLGSLAKGAGSLDDAGKVIATSGDDIVNAGDDLLRLTSGTADDIIQSGASFADDIAANLDDGMKIVGKAVAENGDELVVVQNAAGKTAAFVRSGNTVGGKMVDSIDEVAAMATKAGAVYDDIGGLLTHVDDVAGAVDDAVNVGSTALATLDDVANAGSKGLSVVDDVINATDDVVGAVDDVAKAGNTALATLDDVANAGSKGLSVVDDVINATDDVAGAVDDVANATKQGLGHKIASKVDQMVTNFGTNTKVGQGLANLAAKAGPTVTNAVAAGTGAIVGGALTDPMESTAYRQMTEAIQTPTAGQALYEETTLTPEQLPQTNPNPTQNPNVDPNAPGQGGQTPPGGENPTTNPDTPTGPVGGGSGSPDPEPTSVRPVPTSTIRPIEPTSPRPTIPTPTPIEPTAIRPTVPTSTPVRPTPTAPKPTVPSITDPIITPDDPKPTDPTIPRKPGNPSTPIDHKPTPGVPGGDSSNTAVDTFANSGDSISSIMGSGTKIPTSSAPIVNTDAGTAKKSFIPIAAGLGAASIAGLGTKAYLDKKQENEEEEEDTIETEEWEEDPDALVDSTTDLATEEGDYLSPTDEYAFQE